MSKQNWRWINDTHEVPASEKLDYEQAKNELTFTWWCRQGKRPEDLLERQTAQKYSEWIATKASTAPPAARR